MKTIFLFNSFLQVKIETLSSLKWKVKLCCRKKFIQVLMMFIFGLLTALQSWGQTTSVPYTTVGAGTWFCPAGVTSVTVECWGAGGAGGGATGNPAAGGGGAGGAYTKSTLAVTPGTTYNLSVGAGGTGGTGAGPAGGSSWFNTNTTLLAVGGTGGALASSNNTTAVGATAPTTGNIGGTTNFYGGNGGTGGASGASGGGGGGSAGTAVKGNSASGVTGGAAVAGGGAGVNGSTSSADGADNTNLGGGGAGGRAGSNSDRNGGNGGPGKVVVAYTTPGTYKSLFTSMSIGSTTWCAGETRTITVTVKNNGTAAWVDLLGQDINVGVKWNADADYNVRTDVLGLAAGATGTYSFTVTAPTTTGTNNLTFDIVYEGLSWFANNGGGTGPGNVVYKSANLTINALPAQPSVITGSAAPCLGSSQTYSVTNVAGTTYNWVFPSGWTQTAGGTTNSVTATVGSTSGIVQVTPATTSGGCVGTARTLAVTVSPQSVGGTATSNQTICSGSSPANITLTGNTGTIQWQSSTDNLTFTNISGATASPLTSAQMGTLTSTRYYRAVVTSSPCNAANSNVVTVTVNPASTLVFTSGTQNATVCLGSTLPSTVYTFGGSATNAAVTNLPDGLSSIVNTTNKTVTISGTPTVGGTYTITTSGHIAPCTGATINGTVTLNIPSALAFTSGIQNPTVCAGTAIANTVYTFSGSATNAAVTNLPAGLSSSVNTTSKTVTISGTPTANGTYTITTSGHTAPCTAATITGTVTVIPVSTIVRTNGVQNPTVCEGTAITSTVYTYGGSATNAIVTNLPPGLGSSVNTSAKTVTISGTPTANGTYTIITNGETSPCSSVSIDGTITINIASHIILSSGTQNQTVCAGSAIANTVYTFSGSATNAVVTGLPTGLSSVIEGNTVTISGTPTASGTYTITTSGHTAPCTAAAINGTVMVNPAATLVFTSGEQNSAVCEGTAIPTTVYTFGGTATTVSVTNLPAGLIPAIDIANKKVTISGTPTASGMYTITTIGQSAPCEAATINGTVTVNTPSTIGIDPESGPQNQILCTGSPIEPVTYNFGGSATDAVVSNLLEGLTAEVNTGDHIVFIYGVPTTSGTYTITTSGETPPCSKVTISGSFTLETLPDAGPVTGNITPCEGSTQTYSVAYIPRVNYQWTLPSGWTGTSSTNSINVTVGSQPGEVQVRVLPANTCGYGAPGTLTLTVRPLTASAGTITGTPTVCKGQTGVEYSVPAIANASGYVWTLPSGASIASGDNTNSITVDYSMAAVSGIITVHGTNTYSCGDGPSSSFPVIVHTTPVITSQPSNQTVCESVSTAHFTVAAVDGSLTYQWQENQGSGFADITDGGIYTGARLATLTITSPSAAMNGYTYQCVVNGNCPPAVTSNTAMLNVAVAPTVADAGDDQYLCGTSTILAANAPTVGTGAWSIQSGTGGSFADASNPSSTFMGTAGSTYTLRWTISNAPCTASTDDVVIEFLPKPAAAGIISGISPVCAGISNVNYSIPDIAGATSYIWAYSGNGATIKGLGNSITIDFASDVTAGNLTVKGVNKCGEGTISANYPIAVTASPVTTTDVTICAGESGSPMTVTSICPNLLNQSTGARNAGTGANVTGVGNVAWSGLGNMTSPGTPYTTVVPGNGATSNYLRATNYGFNIPTNAIINGIQLVINRSSTQSLGYGNRDNEVKLVKDNVIQGTNKAVIGSGNTNVYPTNFATRTYGGAADLWNTSWSPSDINNANFGAVLSVYNTRLLGSATASIDYMQITVNYSVPGNITWYTQSSGGTIVQTGASLNPIGNAEVIAQGGIYANLVNTSKPDIYRFFAECSSTPGCRAATDFVIKAVPIMTSTNALTICSGEEVTLDLTSDMASTYSWIATPNDNVTGESTTAQSTNTISDKLFNTTAVIQTVTYKVTTISNASSCAGTPQIVTITINPAPSMSSANVKTICTNEAPDIELTSNIASTYSWIASANANVDGESTTAISSSIINDNLVNATGSIQWVTYTVTPTSIIGSCTGTPQTITVQVNPILEASITPNPASVVYGSTLNLNGNPTGGSGTYYKHTWTGVGTAYLSSSNIQNPTFSGAPVGTYTLTYTVIDDTGCVGSNNITVEVTKAVLTVTADAQIKVYGEPNDVLTFQYSGWKNSDDESVLDTKPNASTTVDLATNVGIHQGAITVEGGQDNNYDFTYMPADYEVTKAMLTVTADAQTKVYGDVNDDLTFKYSGWKNNEDESVLETKPKASTTVDLATNVGIHTGAITVDGGEDNNYDFTYLPADYEVTKAMLTVTADTQTKVYGEPNDVLTFQYSGWKNGEGESVLDTKPTAGTSVDLTTNVGIHQGAITVEGGQDNNYDFTYTAADYEVTKAMLTVTADAQTKVYGEPNDVLTFQYSGWKNGEGESVLDTKPAAGTSVDLTTNVGSHQGAITVEGGQDNNYDFSYAAADYEVTKAMLTVTADAQTKVYGDVNDVLTFQYSGWKNSDDESVLDTKPKAGTSVDLTTNVGNHQGAITIAGGLDNNYDFTYMPADYEVTKAMLTVTADAQTKVYGEPNDVLTFQYSGWKNSDDESVLDTKPTAVTSVDLTTNVGSHQGAITVEGGEDNNYDFSYAAADYEVTKAMLTVTADAQTKVYGEPNDVLTFQYSGWKNSDDESVLDTKPTAVTSVDLTTNVGSHQGAITVEGGQDNNYDFTYVAADYEVTKAMLTVTADAQTKVYGEANDVLTFQYSGWKNSEDESVLDTKPTAVTTVDLLTNVGNHVGSITVSGGADNNYDFTYVTADYEVTKAMLTVTADAKTKVYGETNDVLTFQYSGWKNADGVSDLDTKPTASTYVNLLTNVGNHIGAITVSGGADNNYDFTYVAADYEVTKAMLTVTADAQTKVYGETNDVLSFQYSGWKNSEDEFVLDTKPTASTTVNLLTNVGNHIGAITVSGGADNNYDFTYMAADYEVTKAMLTVTAHAQTKVYGETNDLLTFQYSGWKNNEDESVLDTKPTASTTVSLLTNVGNHIGAITVSGGADNNYDFTYVAADYEITQKPITGNFTVDLSKVYNGNTLANVITRTLNDVIAPDIVNLSGGIANYDNKNVGTGKTVTLTGMSLSGDAAGNYSLTTVATTTASITVCPINVTAQTDTRLYNGTISSSVAPVIDVLQSGDVIATVPVQVYDTKHVGTGKVMVASGLVINDGNGGTNYSVNYLPDNTGVITVRPITVTAVTDSKVYDGGVSSDELVIVPSLQFGDVIGTAPTQLYDNPNVQTGKTMSASGLVINDGNSSNNYSITYLQNFTGAITPLVVNSSVSVNTTNVQYSDQVTFTASITGGAPLVIGGPQAAPTVTFKVGTQVMNATPTALVVSGSDLVATFTAPLIETVANQMSPGVKTVSAVFNSPNINFTVSPTTATTPLTITQEDARIDYTGDVIKATATATTFSATVTLRANILDITVPRSPADINYDPYGGDIRNAKVMFVNRDAGNASISGWLPVSTLVNASDSKIGTVSFNYLVNGLSSSTPYEFITVGIIVDNGYYIRNNTEDDLVVTVYTPVGDFITGGGYITPSQSVGTLNSDPGKKVNFGFNVKFNKKGTNLQGNMNIIFRRTESDNKVHTYQIKANAMQSLGVNASNLLTQTAEYVSKTNITDITNSSASSSLGGNKLLYVKMVDNGEPGLNDLISFALVDGSSDPTVLSNLIYSSNWVNSKTDKLNLNGGNLVVHSGFSMNPPAMNLSVEIPTGTNEVTSESTLKAYPNPFTEKLNIEFSSVTDAQAKLEIYSITGAKLETLYIGQVKGGQLYTFEYLPHLVSSQMVFYHLTIDGETYVGKMVYNEKR